MRSTLAFSFFLLAAAAHAAAQAAPDPLVLADSIRQEIDLAVQARDWPKVEAAKRHLDRATTLFPKDGLLLHYRAHTANMLTFAGDSLVPAATKAALMKEATEEFATSAKLLPLAESHIIRWSLLAQTMTTSPDAMATKQAMDEELAAALKLGKDNPRVWLMQGIVAYFVPVAAGGGPKLSLEYLIKAQALFAKDRPAKGMPSWGGLDIYIWLGLVHARLGHEKESQLAYSEALRAAPNLAWVEKVLVPALVAGKVPFST